MKLINILFSGFLSLILLSCSASDDINIQDAQFIVYPNSSIKVTEADDRRNLDVVNGDKLVFAYTFDEPGDPDIADSGYSHYLYFELDKDTEDFKLNSDDFQIVKANFRRSCFCVYTDFRKIENGEINGKKTGNMTWKVTFDVNTLIEENEEIVTEIKMSDSGTFRPSN